MNSIEIREVPIVEALKVDETIVEFDDKFSEEQFEERYHGREHIIIVAYVDGGPAGYLVGYDRDSDGSFYCWMAGVNPLFRKRGILKSLMSYEDDWAKSRGYVKIKVKTRNKHQSMLSYLKKYGFSITGTEPRPDDRETRIFLEKDI
ncbi:MAG: GNAT family N-acetyltransferase [Candidatus Woesearchaeota archaeon]